MIEEQRIQQRIIDSADLAYQWAEPLARPIADATQALLACVTGGGRVLVCGSGASAALGQYAAALLVGGFERSRPELPAIDLNGLVCGVMTDALAAQVRALGGPDDVLLLLSVDGRGASLLRVLETAQERDIGVVALTGSGGGEIGGRLRDTDVHICVPSENPPHIHEAHQLVLHCLCDGLDRQLLGDEENPA